MRRNVSIRSETKADVSVIAEVTVEAFKTLEISSQTELYVIAVLSADNALTLLLVAKVDGHVVGHIAFLPVTISHETQDWYGPGPVSVLLQYQRQGVDKVLIQEGLSRLSNMSAKGCCVVRHPEYYRQFGFKNMTRLVYQGIPREAFFVVSFNGHISRGKVTFHEGFNANG
jgi:putative acetyltransferase